MNIKIITYIIAVFVFVPTAIAQSFELQKPVTCSSTILVFQALFEQAGELPVWLGLGTNQDTSKTVLLTNPGTKTWTIVQFDKDKACVLGSGIGNQQIFNGPAI
jgi:hypothetical protein